MVEIEDDPEKINTNEKIYKEAYLFSYKCEQIATISHIILNADFEKLWAERNFYGKDFILHKKSVKIDYGG